MPISLIANVAIYRNKLAIGKDNDLLFKFKQDLTYFRMLTYRGIVVMGRKTYESLPISNRPLKNRITIVFTTNDTLIDYEDFEYIKSLDDLVYDDVYYMTSVMFKSLYNATNSTQNIYVIGGSVVYDFFMNLINNMIPNKLYITHVLNPTFLVRRVTPDTFMPNFDDKYTLSTYSAIMSENQNNYKYNFRLLTYTLNRYDQHISQEYKYNDLMQLICTTGNIRADRTNTGTMSLFGKSLEFDISSSIPMMTTRSVPFKAIVEELLWFCRGDTSNKVLQSKGVNIWNGNSSREFLDSRGLKHYPEDIIGPSYGWQWRFCGAKYNYIFADTSKYTHTELKQLGGIDQLENIVSLLQTDPFSRRIIMINYNPSVLDKVALPACHTQVQFYVREVEGTRYLSCKFDMRSSDSLAWSYNCVSYSILTYILAMKCGMTPDKLIYTSGDCHIYQNHLEQVKEQTSRTLRPEPKLHIDDSIKNKDWSQMVAKDFELIGYFPHPSIKMDMAI